MRRRWQLQVGGHGDEGAAWSRVHAGCCQQQEIARLSWHAPHSLLCLACSPPCTPAAAVCWHQLLTALHPCLLFCPQAAASATQCWAWAAAVPRSWCSR